MPRLWVDFGQLLGMKQALVELCEAQNWRCAYCGVRFDMSSRGADQAPSTDEVLPRSLGGQPIPENQVAACRGCNSARGSIDAYEFYAAVQSATGAGAMRALLAALALRQGKRAARQRLRLDQLKAIAVEVPTSPGRLEYFEMIYGTGRL